MTDEITGTVKLRNGCHPPHHRPSTRVPSEPADPTDPDPAALSEVWLRTLEAIDDAVTSQERAFVRLCTLDGVVGETALLSVPHEYAKDIVEQRLRPVITTTLTDAARPRDPHRRRGGPQPRGRRAAARRRTGVRAARRPDHVESADPADDR